MARQMSYTKHENKLLHDLRQKLNKAESTEDVKKFFVHTSRKLFDSVSDGRMDSRYEDIALQPGKAPYYRVADRLSSTEAFDSVWSNSDLSRVLGRFAEAAVGHYRHLEKNPEKTKSKIRN